MAKSLKGGDSVAWKTPQGETRGKVVKKVTRSEKAGGHAANASEKEPQYRVRSGKTGKEAIHKADALKKA